MSYSKPDTVMFVNFNWASNLYKLKIFTLNDAFSIIKDYRSIDISYKYRYFHIIDGKVVFMNIRRHNLFLEFWKLMYIDNNESFVEIENTGASLKTRVSFYTNNVSSVIL
jgi:hypothetical protein